MLFRSAGLITATGNVTGGNLTTAGVVTATGNGTFGNVLTGGIVSATGNGTFGNVSTPNVSGAALTLTASSGNLNLTATSGNIVVNSVNINSVANPVLAQDAATKAYVDNSVSAGIDVHNSVVADSDSNLTGTYANGGTTPTWTTITTGDTIATASAHGLSVNDVIVFEIGRAHV